MVFRRDCNSKFPLIFVCECTCTVHLDNKKDNNILIKTSILSRPTYRYQGTPRGGVWTSTPFFGFIELFQKIQDIKHTRLNKQKTVVHHIGKKNSKIIFKKCNTRHE